MLRLRPVSYVVFGLPSSLQSASSQGAMGGKAVGTAQGPHQCFPEGAVSAQ